MRVLYIAFYFPPTTGGGVERTLRFLEHLPSFGVDVEVLVPDDARWLDSDPSSLARIPSALVVHRCRYRGPSTRVLPGNQIARARGGRRLLVRATLAPRRLLIPDVNVGWLLDVVPAALRLLRSGRFDAIVTTAPPHSVAVAGAILARRSGLPWVADWRDGWLDNPDVPVERAIVALKQRLIAPLARWSASRMNGASCVNEAIADEVRRLQPRAVVAVVPNGADVERIMTISSVANAEMTFVYTGYFFGDRGPDTVLDGLAALLHDRPDLAPRVRFRFIGGLPQRSLDRVKSLGLTEVVEALESVGFRDALIEQRRADVLLLFMQDRAGSEAVVPAKTWEYLAAERPVLAVVPPHGAAAALVRTYGVGEVVAPGDAPAARRVLETLFDRWREGTLVCPPLDPSALTGISRRGRAEQLARLIETVITAKR